MPFRITEAATSAMYSARITASRQQLAVAQERVSSGKRINRPSDDPLGAASVIRLRTSQAEIEQFKRNAAAAGDSLQFADGALNDYELLLDRARALVTQGASDTTSADARKIIATELEGLSARILSVANSRSDDTYIFGGTRQDASPFDATGAPTASPSSKAFVQIEPNAPPLASGVTSESVFADVNGNIFGALAATAAALRGTGDAAADRATLNSAPGRLASFSDLASVARAQLGASLQNVEAAGERMGRNYLALEESAGRIEGADLAESALQLAQSQQALEATLQASANTGRRSLLDFLS